MLEPQLRSFKGAIEDQFKIHKSLGDGSFGKVLLAEDETGKTFAAKLPIATSGLEGPAMVADLVEKVQKLHREMELQAEVQCLTNHVVRVFLKSQDGALMEFLAGGDLFNASASEGRPEFTNGSRRTSEDWNYLYKDVMGGLTEAVAVLHGKGIAHRDIKPENVMLDGRGQVKLGDFGFAVCFTRGERSHERKGTFHYMAPEILVRFPSYSLEKADMFGLGATLFGPLTMDTLWRGSENEIIKVARQGLAPSTKTSLHISLSAYIDERLTAALDEELLRPEGIHVLSQMLQIDPDERSPAMEMLKADWPDRSKKLETRLFAENLHRWSFEASAQTAAGEGEVHLFPDQFPFMAWDPSMHESSEASVRTAVGQSELFVFSDQLPFMTRGLSTPGSGEAPVQVANGQSNVLAFPDQLSSMIRDPSKAQEREASAKMAVGETAVSGPEQLPLMTRDPLRTKSRSSLASASTQYEYNEV
jgi:serine/threonine protein kinase